MKPDFWRDRNWRLVCHHCGFKYPMKAAGAQTCCSSPSIHIHDTDKPCTWCKETEPA